MKSLKIMIAVAAVSGLLATSAYAQAAAPAPQTPAPGQQKPAPATPALPGAQKPAPPAAPQPPRPFPEGAKFAFVDIQVIASNSSEGKAATAKLDELRKKTFARMYTYSARRSMKCSRTGRRVEGAHSKRLSNWPVHLPRCRRTRSTRVFPEPWRLFARKPWNIAAMIATNRLRKSRTKLNAIWRASP